jgi:hypothetical protein
MQGAAGLSNATKQWDVRLRPIRFNIEHNREHSMAIFTATKGCAAKIKQMIRSC